MTQKLTPKEMEILNLLSRGLSSLEIAQRLGNSKKTIDAMRATMLVKTKSRNTAHLMAFACQNNLLPRPADSQES